MEKILKELLKRDQLVTVSANAIHELFMKAMENSMMFDDNFEEHQLRMDRLLMARGKLGGRIWELLAMQNMLRRANIVPKGYYEMLSSCVKYNALKRDRLKASA